MIVSIRILPNPPKSLQSYTIFGLNSSDSYSVIATNGVITCNITSPTSSSYTLHCECIPTDLTERKFSLFNKNSNISILDYFLDPPEVNMKILSQNQTEQVKLNKNCGGGVGGYFKIRRFEFEGKVAEKEENDFKCKGEKILSVQFDPYNVEVFNAKK